MFSIEAFKEAVKLALLKNYTNFSGRANRPEYWYFFLFNIGISIIFGIIGAILPASISSIISIISGLCSLALLVPGIALGVRRLHDINKSGWFLLIALIPIAGLYIIYLLVQPSDEGSNNFGQPSNNLR